MKRRDIIHPFEASDDIVGARGGGGGRNARISDTRGVAEKLAKAIEDSGTRNYLVFDPQIAEFIKKFGLVAAVGAGMISEEQARQAHAQGGKNAL